LLVHYNLHVHCLHNTEYVTTGWKKSGFRSFTEAMLVLTKYRLNLFICCRFEEVTLCHIFTIWPDIRHHSTEDIEN